MSESAAAVTLKLKVSNRETGLLEWRPCECSVSSDAQLVVQPTLDTDSDDEGDEEANVNTAAATAISIDLATQLRGIEQKKKNKARCELTYTLEAGGRARQELMAPTAKTCQQWVDQVLEAQQRARRLASARQGAAAANARAASVSPLPRALDSAADSHERDVQAFNLQSSRASARVDYSGGALMDRRSSLVDDGQSAGSACGGQTEAVTSKSTTMASSAASNSSLSTSGVSFFIPPAAASQLNTGRVHRQRSCHGDGRAKLSRSAMRTFNASSTPSGSHKRVDLTTSSLSSCSSESESESESSIMDASYSVRFLPTRSKLSRLGPRHYENERSGHRYTSCNNDEEEEEDEHELSRLSPRSCARVAAALRRQRERLERRQHERSVEATSYPSPHRDSQLSQRQRGSFRRSPSIGSGLMDPLDAVHVSSIARDGNQRSSNQDDPDSRRHHAQSDEASSRQELRMLQRVEEALRHLEHENAQRKQREEALAAQVQALKDALRIKAAEREHVACELRATLRDKDKWQQKAQTAERMAGQLREELAIAREEAQLLARDKLRLKRQNGELLAQVHRLDSLVYGRF